jgi:hypothetical protein
MSAFFCVLLSCVGTDLEMGRSPIQRVLAKCLDGFMVSEVHSESGQVRGPYP